MGSAQNSKITRVYTTATPRMPFNLSKVDHRDVGHAKGVKHQNHFITGTIKNQADVIKRKSEDYRRNSMGQTKYAMQSNGAMAWEAHRLKQRDSTSSTSSFEPTA